MSDFRASGDDRLQELIGEALRHQDHQDSLRRQVEVELFLGGPIVAQAFPYLPHTGDVHAPGEFGFDMNNPDDAVRWQQITGETPVIPPNF